ncbi:MAG: hypothetical protein ABWY78_10560 [Microvirga sp.]
MKVSRFARQQIAVLLKPVDDGAGTEEACRGAGISQQTADRGRKEHGGRMPSEVRRLKHGALVVRQVVEDDSVAWRPRGHELCLDVGLEGPAGERAIEHSWRARLMASQIRDEGWVIQCLKGAAKGG